MTLWVKVCGVRTVEEAEHCVAAGADAVGLNFVRGSKRFVEPAPAAAIVSALRGRTQWVAVVADEDLGALKALRERVGFDLWQLHGEESPELLESLGADAYKAVRVATAADVERASRFGGQRLLVDAKVSGALGGTGHSFDWQLVKGLARQRPLVVAGGLTPGNVGQAVAAVHPAGVDVASGVETAAGLKDPDLVRAYVIAARLAAASSGGKPRA